MDKYFYKNVLIGFRLRAIPNGSIPATESHEYVQMVTLKHKKGKYLAAHIHTPQKRETAYLQECLFVRKGKIRIDLFSRDKEFVKKIFLKEGDTFLLLNGGFGIQLLQDSELIEVKNGPFIEDKQFI